MKIRIERIYPYPCHKVWAALTQAEALAHWLMENDFKLVKGHLFRFTTEPGPGFDGLVHCEVLDFVEQSFLEISWRGGPIDTVVRFELETLEDGTRLTMTQSGFSGVKGRLIALMLKWGGRQMYDKKLPQVLARIDSEGYWPDRVPQEVPRCWSPRARIVTKLIGWIEGGRGGGKN